jgi:hypothetical protein
MAKKKKIKAQRRMGPTAAIRSEIKRLSDEELLAINVPEFLQRVAAQGPTITNQVKSKASTLLTKARAEAEKRSKGTATREVTAEDAAYQYIEPAMEYVRKCGSFQAARASLDALEGLMGTIEEFKAVVRM